MNFLTFISHVVSFQFKQPLFFFFRGLQAHNQAASRYLVPYRNSSLKASLLLLWKLVDL